MLYKGLIRKIVLVLVVVLAVCMFSCATKGNAKDKNFSVTFLSVGQGDSAYCSLSNGKNLLIDTGPKGKSVLNNIEDILAKDEKTELDYFVLTHTGIDHVGNASDIAEKFRIKTAFLPDVLRPERFIEYNLEYTAVIEKAQKIVNFSTNISICEDDYFLAFLSPTPKGSPDSFYNEVNGIDNPNEGQLNDISAVLYLEHSGIRFLFLADACENVQKLVYNNYLAGYYDFLYGEGKINLEDIDVLKVAHHGASDSVFSAFHYLLNAKHCVISVGRGNLYGHPNSQTIEKLVAMNSDCKILRTDVYGNITFNSNGEGLKITTEKGGL